MITGWEWILVLGIIAVLVLYGPKKIPELAKALGQAKSEFEQASKELKNTINVSTQTTKKKEIVEDNTLFETAKKLGVTTEGKTKEQISNEIIERFNSMKKE